MPTFYWTTYTFKDVYAYLSRLYYKTFHRLKYYFYAFREYYNSNFNKIFCEERNAFTSLGIEPRTFQLPVECSII